MKKEHRDSYTKFYAAITEPIRHHTKRVRFVQMSNLVLELVFYALYPLLLLYILRKDPSSLMPAVAVPALMFAAVSYARKRIGRLRPYEELDIHPLILKDSSKNSLPSRHVFSAVIIAMLYLNYNVWIGSLLLFLGILAALVRVAGGVHYPSDTVAGYLCGVVGGLLFRLIVHL